MSKRLPVFRAIAPSNSAESRSFLIRDIDSEESSNSLERLLSSFGSLHVFDTHKLPLGEIKLSYYSMREAQTAYSALESSYSMLSIPDPTDYEFIDCLLIEPKGVSFNEVCLAFSSHLLGHKRVGKYILLRFDDVRLVWQLRKQYTKETYIRPSQLDLAPPRTDQVSKFVIDLWHIQDATDRRTTVMIKNIPNKYTQKMLVEDIDKNFSGTYDFLYLPIDFKNKCNMGYAFINFLFFQQILRFYEEFDGQKWGRFQSEKICALSYARIQGLQALLLHFRKSSIMAQDKALRPLILY